MEQYDRYLNERHALINARFQVAESLDKALLALSGGALAISMTFLREITGNPTLTWALITAWILFGLTIAVLLLTFHLCGLAYDTERKNLDHEQTAGSKKSGNEVEDRNETKQRKNVWSTLTAVGNVVAMLLFFVGLAFVGMFILCNMQACVGE